MSNLQIPPKPILVKEEYALRQYPTPAEVVISKHISAECRVDGLVFRYDRHFVYWRHLSNGDTRIVIFLHERMHHIYHLQDDCAPG